jgi:WD40 repeat protein
VATNVASAFIVVASVCILAASPADVATVRVVGGAVVRFERSTRPPGHVQMPVTLGPDGKLMAAVGDDGSLAIFEAASGRLRCKLGRLARGDAAAFSPDGKYLVASMADGTVRLWDGTTGKSVFVLQNETLRAASATFSSDGKLIALVSDSCRIELRDTASGAVRFRIAADNHGERAAVFAPGGRSFATVDGEGRLHVWDLSRKSQLVSITGFERGGFSPDGRFLLASCRDGTIHVLELPSAKRRMKMVAGSAGITSAEFALDSKTLVTLSTDNILRIWDPANGEMRSMVKVSHEGELAIDLKPQSGVVAPWQNDDSVLVCDVEIKR